MVLINSSKIFISIRRPHATCIINAQPEGHNNNFYHIHISIGGSPAHAQRPTGTRVCKWKWMRRHSTGEVKGQPKCILGRRRAAYAADVSRRPSRRSPRECLCWGNTILSFRLSPPPPRVDVLPSRSRLCLSIPAGSLPTRRLYRGRTQPETQDEIQGGRVCTFSAL